MKKKQVKKVQKKKTTNLQTVKRKKIKKIKTKKRKIRYGRILIALVCCICFFFIGSKLLDFRIQNIYISGNQYLSDQEIIELAGIENYPSYYKTFAFEISKKLEQDSRIAKAIVKKKKRRSIWIEITENTPLFYNQTTGKTILLDFREVAEMEQVPVLVNYVPDTIYETFKQKMKLVDTDLIARISEIMYQPNHVDEERFLFIMCDGNYVYVTLETLESINNYVNIYAEFTSKYGNKKGILNLDSGQYFTILE